MPVLVIVCMCLVLKIEFKRGRKKKDNYISPQFASRQCTSSWDRRFELSTITTLSISSSSITCLFGRRVSCLGLRLRLVIQMVYIQIPFPGCLSVFQPICSYLLLGLSNLMAWRNTPRLNIWYEIKLVLVYIVFFTVLINIPGIMTNNLPKIIYGTAWFVLSHVSVNTDCTLNLI